MKVTWEPEDIKAGRIIYSPNHKARFILSFRSDVGEKGPRWFYIRLDDGLIYARDQTAEQLAEDFTRWGYLPYELVDLKWLSMFQEKPK